MIRERFMVASEIKSLKPIMYHLRRTARVIPVTPRPLWAGEMRVTRRKRAGCACVIGITFRRPQAK